jgi:lipopolysaccharide transport system ATP-binding protein
VKRYSSAIYVPLAFEEAGHLESKIMIVDELLAVRVAEFQKKCLGKMGEVSKGGGRTVLFVNHYRGAVKNLCIKSILLTNGIIHSVADTKTIISNFLALNLNTIQNSKGLITINRSGNGIFKFTRICHIDDSNNNEI